jgi:hypothetical protein
MHTVQSWANIAGFAFQESYIEKRASTVSQQGDSEAEDTFDHFTKFYPSLMFS